jgi:hypothetical protein
VASSNAPLYSLNAGEVSKIALARVGVAKPRMAAACQVNWLPFVVGPMMLRPGASMSGKCFPTRRRSLCFVFSKLDTSLIELAPNKMPVWINEVLLTRMTVGAIIGDPFFAGSGSRTTANTTSGASVTLGNNAVTLLCRRVGGLALIQQTMTVPAADQGKEHGIRIVVTNGPVILRASSTAGGSDVISQTELDTGTHSLSCYPSGNFTIQIESADPQNKTLTQCSIEAAGPVVLPTPVPRATFQHLLPPVGRHDLCRLLLQAAHMIQRRGVRPGARLLHRVRYRSDRPWFQPGDVDARFRLFSNRQSYQTQLGPQNAYTLAVRAVGVSTQARDYTWTFWGTWANIADEEDTGLTVHVMNVYAHAVNMVGPVAAGRSPHGIC